MANKEFFYTEEDMEIIEEFPVKNNHRKQRIRTTDIKRKRKEKIANAIYPDGFHVVAGYFRKGKIHCSCPMCTAKTNDKINCSKGPVSETVLGKHKVARGTRLTGTHHRYTKNWTPTDRRRIDEMRDQLKEIYET